MLEPHRPTRHLVTGPERNEYRIAAAADEYLRISITQLNAALKISLLAPDGQEVIKTDNSNGKLERLVFSALLPQAGAYRLLLENTSNFAFSSFTINIEEQRAATPEDKLRVSSERTLLEADRLRAEGSTESIAKAIEAYERVLTFWRQVKSPEEAETLTTLGQLHAAIDQKEKAVRYLNQALSVWRANGNVYETASTLSGLGLIYKRSDLKLNALDNFQEALAVWRVLGDRSKEAYILQNLGETYAAFSDTRKSLDQYNQALKIWREIGNREGEAFTLAAIGRLYDSSGDYFNAWSYYDRALQLWSREDSAFGKDYMIKKLNRVLYFTGGPSGAAAGSVTGPLATGAPASAATDPSETAKQANRASEITAGTSRTQFFDSATEDALWQQLDSFNDPLGFAVYLNHFPGGRFANQAKGRLNGVETLTSVHKLFENTYENAIIKRHSLEANSPPAGYIEIERKPTLDVPDPIVESKDFDVLVSLTTGAGGKTPEVKVTQGNAKTPEQISLQLPEQDGWPIDVVLMAPDFVLPEGNRATLFLQKIGDSTPARFKLRAKPVRGPQQISKIFATFWYKDAFLGKIERDATIVTAAAVQQGAPAPASVTPQATSAPEQQSGIRMKSNLLGADLTIVTVKIPNSEQRQIFIGSRYLGGFTAPQIYSQSGLSDWLMTRYSDLSNKSAQLAQFGSADDATARIKLAEETKAFVRVFSGDLYEKFCPPLVKDAFWVLSKRIGANFKTIQIYSDDFEFPWELMRPINIDGKERGLLGTEFAIGRWHITSASSGLEVPPKDLSINKLVVIAPHYAAPTQGLPTEIETLKSMSGYEPVAGKFDDVKKLFQDFPLAIIYFAGHGSILATQGNLYRYSIQLEDRPLDVMTWRGMITSQAKNHPLLFFNACSVGQTQNIANFVDGWAPAVLDAGASGYVGALWPVSQHGAGSFGTTFYREFDRRLKLGRASVAETLMQTRTKFFENGDPTFLAYVYFGDADLGLLRPAK